MNKTDKNCFSWLEIDNSTTLNDLNDQFTQRHLGGIIFTGILMVFGILGNFFVLLIYIRRFKKSNYRTYAIWLASIDIGNSCLGMPFLIYYMSHYLIFPSSAFCKLGRFIYIFTTNCSAYILVVIAFDRYRKICKHFEWQFTQNHAIVSCIIATCIGLFTSWPAFVLFGIYTVGTKIPNVVGIRCWTDDKYRNTDYPGIYYIGLYFFNFTVVPILFIAYIQILRSLRDHRRTGLNVNTRKTTVTLLVVTVFFILSAVPHFSLVITTRLQKDFNCLMTFPEGVLYYTFVFSILLNNSVNPFIYGFLDHKFRKELKCMYRNVFRIQTTEDTDFGPSDTNDSDARGSRNEFSLKEMNSKETYIDD